MIKKIKNLVTDESGATAIEYSLIAAATGLVLVATMPIISTALETTLGSLGAGMTNP